MPDASAAILISPHALKARRKPSWRSTSQALTRIGRLYRDRYFLFKAALEEGKDQYDVDDVEELDMLRAVVKRWAQSTAAEQVFSPSERGEIIGVSEHPEYSRPEQLLDAEEACMRWARAVFAAETGIPAAKKPNADKAEPKKLEELSKAIQTVVNRLKEGQTWAKALEGCDTSKSSVRRHAGRLLPKGKPGRKRAKS